MKKKFPLFIILIFNFLYLSAQITDKQSLSNDSLIFEGEKLYIHTDKDTYVAGDTIWFKGYLANSSYLSKLPLSNYIYAELYCDSLVSRVKIKYSNKGYAGYIPISKDVASGNYTIRGYTKNMQNYPSEFAFQKSIMLLKRGKDSTSKIEPVIKAIDYGYDVQFLPESGRYITNRPARIAFKAIRSDGQSADISVALYNNSDVLVGQYESRHKGMGLITILNADADGYYAIVSCNEGFIKKIILPKPVLSGATICVNRIGNKIDFTNYVTSNISGAVFLVMNGSEELIRRPLTTDCMQDGLDKNIILSSQTIPEGINSAQIMNGAGEILAERLFFINRYSAPKIEVLLNKTKYEKREKVELTFSLKDITGKPVIGEFSLTVTDSSLAPLLIRKDNILTYMELSSELHGYIEDPAYYFFNPTKEKENYLDIVMMTHGWRYHTPGLRKYNREYYQELSGFVSGLFKKEPKNTTLMVIAPAIQLQQAFMLQKKNTFLLEGLDFPDSTKFLIGISGKGGGQLFGLSIDEEQFFPIPPLKKTYYNQVEKESIKKASALISEISPFIKNINLKPVVVVARREFFTPKYNPSPFLQTFSRSQLKEREDLKEYDDLPLMDYIVRTFPGIMIGSGETGRILQSSRRVGRIGGALTYPEPEVYLDGMKLADNTTYLDQFLVQDVENVGFLRGTAGSMFNTLYGVILISLKRGRFVSAAPSNIAKVNPLGYQKSVEFYSPKYETTAQRESSQNDLRCTLYWNPCIRTDGNGCATVTFYTGDHIPKLNISAEGITSTGDFIVSH